MVFYVQLRIDDSDNSPSSPIPGEVNLVNLGSCALRLRRNHRAFHIVAVGADRLPIHEVIPGVEDEVVGWRAHHCVVDIGLEIEMMVNSVRARDHATPVVTLHVGGVRVPLVEEFDAALLDGVAPVPVRIRWLAIAPVVIESEDEVLMGPRATNLVPYNRGVRLGEFGVGRWYQPSISGLPTDRRDEPRRLVATEPIGAGRHPCGRRAETIAADVRTAKWAANDSDLSRHGYRVARSWSFDSLHE